MGTLSLRGVAACLGVHGDFSVLKDIFIFAAGSPMQSVRQVLTQMQQDCWPYIQIEDLLSIKASASVSAPPAIDPAGLLHTMSFAIEIKNLTNETVHVYHSAVLLTDSGGWVHMSSPLYGSNSPLEGQTSFIPAGQAQTGSYKYYWGSGPFNMVINIWAQAGPKLQHIVRRVPILRGGYAAPPVIQVPAPVYIGLWNRPVEVFDVWRTDHQATWLTLAGQIVNLWPYNNVTVDSWHVTIQSQGNVLLDQELSPAFYSIQSLKDIAVDENGKMQLKEQLSGFVCGFELANLPTDVSKATLKLVLHYTRLVGSGPQKAKAVCVAPLKRMTPAVLVSPVHSPNSGNWQWGNAPDHTTHDAHAWSGERYCYDLVVVDGNGKHLVGNCVENPDGTHSGACTNNSSFYAYGRPIFAAAGGTVQLSVETLDENFGYDANPATKGGNWVVLEHDDGTVSGYFHLRKGTNSVVPKQKIAAGTQVGQTGNSGGSSEPHLHFGYVTLHATGRGVISPVAFSNLKTIAGQLVTVVPGHGQYKS